MDSCVGWETALWDAWPQLAEHSLHTVAWLQRFDRITSGLHKLNKEYGKGLSKLVKKEARGGEEGGSLGAAHRALLEQLTVVAGRHKELAVSLGQLSREGSREADRLLEEHRGAEGEARRLRAGMETTVKRLQSAREKYERKTVEAEQAERRLARVEPDTGISRGEVEQAREEATERRGRASRGREEYDRQLGVTNGQHRGFYRETWPKVFARMREVDTEGGQEAARHLEKLGRLGEDGWPDAEEAWTRLGACVQQMDFRGDFSSFVIHAKTGNPVPAEHVFVESSGSDTATRMTTAGLGYRMGTLRRSMSRTSLRYRTSSFPAPNSARRFSSMVNIRSSLRLHRRTKTQPVEEEEDEDEAGLKRSKSTINNIDEEEEERENLAIRAEVNLEENINGMNERKYCISVEEAIDEIGSIEEVSDDTGAGTNGCYVDENGIHGIEEKDDSIRGNHEDEVDLAHNETDKIITNGEVSEDKFMITGDGPWTMDITSDERAEGGQVTKVEVAEYEEEEDESAGGYTFGETLLDDDNLSAVRMTRQHSTVSTELAMVREEEEEGEEEENGHEDEEEEGIAFRVSAAANPFAGLDDVAEVESLSRTCSRKSVQEDRQEAPITNGRHKGGEQQEGGGGEDQAGYDDRKNPFREAFEAV